MASRPMAPSRAPATCLLDLPDELIDEIFAEDGLVPKDLLNAMFVCRRFRRIASPWLYHTFDVHQLRTTCSTTRRHNGLFRRFASALVASSQNANSVRRISTIADFRLTSNWDDDDEHDDNTDYAAIVDKARSIPVFAQDTLVDLRYGLHYAQLLLIICLTPNLMQLEFGSLGDRVMRATLQALQRALSSSSSQTGHSSILLPRLRTFVARADWTRQLSTHRRLRAAVEDTTFLMALPSMRSFSALRATYESPDVPDMLLHRWSLRVECAPDTSFISSLTFDACELPCSAFTKMIAACKALDSFTCRWGRGPYDLPLHPPDLYAALLTQKWSLKRLVLDVKEVRYLDPAGGLVDHDLDWSLCPPFGDLAPFEKLKDVCISSILLDDGGPCDEDGAAPIFSRLPESLEALVLTSPPSRAAFSSSYLVPPSNMRRLLPRWRALELRQIHPSFNPARAAPLLRSRGVQVRVV